VRLCVFPNGNSLHSRACALAVGSVVVSRSRIGRTQTTHSNNVCGVLNLLRLGFLFHTLRIAHTTDIYQSKGAIFTYRNTTVTFGGRGPLLEELEWVAVLEDVLKVLHRIPLGIGIVLV